MHVAAWKQSGLNQRAYCIEADIGFSNFKNWTTQLAKIKTPFIPIKVNSTQIVKTGQKEIAHLTINYPNGISVTVSVKQLTKVLRALLLC